jgi:hypothetical protein
VVLFIPDGEELCSSLKLDFKTTNNKAYYEANGRNKLSSEDGSRVCGATK